MLGYVPCTALSTLLVMNLLNSHDSPIREVLLLHFTDERTEVQ